MSKVNNLEHTIVCVGCSRKTSAFYMVKYHNVKQSNGNLSIQRTIYKGVSTYVF